MHQSGKSLFLDYGVMMGWVFFLLYILHFSQKAENKVIIKEI